MRKFLLIISLALCAISCTVSEIKTYDVSESALNFISQSAQFSLKTMTEETAILEVQVQLLGPVTDYDREISCSISTEGLSDAAVEGVDYTFLGGKLEAKAMKAVISLEVKKLALDSPRRQLKLNLVPNDNFVVGFPAYQSVLVSWSAEYVRPAQAVWKCWYIYFSQHYSKAYHEVLTQLFGTDIDKYVRSAADARDNDNIYMIPSWWTSASRTLFQYVKEYDAAHPGNPLRHSEDWQVYESYLLGVDDGNRTEGVPPTILETLIVM